MTILWCGGEDIDFTENISINSATTYCKSGSTARCSFYGSGFSKGIANFSAITSGWLSFQGYFGNQAATKNLFICGLVLSSTTNKGLWIGVDASTEGKLALYKYDGSTKTSLASESGTSLNNTVKKIDMHIVSYGVSATVTVYINGALVITYSGDTTVSGVTNLDTVGVGGGYGTVGYLHASEIIVSDADTRAMALVSVIPSAAGTVSDWTGAYTAIDETVISDNDFVSTVTADQIFECNVTDMPSGSYTIKAVKSVVRAADLSMALGLQLGIRVGTTIALSSTKTLDIVPSTQEIIYQVNPETSAAFSKSDIDSLQLAYKSVAL